jgi:hypothetical protein
MCRGLHGANEDTRLAPLAVELAENSHVRFQLSAISVQLPKLRGLKADR